MFWADRYITLHSEFRDCKAVKGGALGMSYGRVVLVLILICTGIVCTSVTADPYSVNNSTQKRWIVANGTDVTKITLDIKNASSFDPINEGYVRFRVNETYYGEFNDSTFIIVNGSVSVNFRSLYKSGTAMITATIMNGTDVIQNVSFEQLIDHDRPFKIPTGGKILPWNGEERVGNVTLIGLYMEDTHRNPIDNRRELDEGEGREAEKVKFMVIGTPGYPDTTAYFLPGNVTNITVQVNGTGWATTPLRMDIRPGANIIKAYPLTTVPDPDPWTIFGIADGMPCSISSRIFTSEGDEQNFTWADGIHYFYILYQLKDEYGNGVQLKNVTITTDLGEYSSVTTNATGAIGVDYGPKSEVGEINITATTQQNSSVTITDAVRFVNLTANDMIFTASSQSLPSYDTPTPRLALLRGLIVDIEGNPVADQQITFNITKVTWDETYNVTAWPKLVQNETDPGVNTTSGSTNESGFTVIYLKPCSFVKIESAQGYDPSATGRCTVEASWVGPNGTIRRPLDFIFKNYPYLSVSTSVSSPKVNVTGTTDVTLWLKADGWALQPPPVEAVLVTDVSLSMNKPDKLPPTKTALKNFVGLANNRTYLGLVSYGMSPNPDLASLETKTLWGRQQANSSLYPFNPYGNFWDRCLVNPNTSAWNNYNGYLNSHPDAKLDTPSGFTQTKKNLNDTIDLYQATGGTNIAAGINGALQMMHTFGQPDRKKVIIVMSDGIATMAPITPTSLKSYWPRDWFIRPDGEDQSITGINAALDAANRAKAEGIEVFTIGFGSKADTANLSLMASPGDYYFAPNGTALNNVYTQIAGKIKTEAGANTTTDLNFENVLVKNVTVPGNETFNYTYVGGISTFIERWNTSFRQNTTRDDTPNWTANHSLDFNIGTMVLNDNWQMTFRLQVLKEGDIHIFDPTSIITFDNGTNALKIPDTVINAVVNLTNESFEYGEFEEKDINVTQITPTTYQWTWTRLYTGDMPVQEYYFISLDGGYQWTLVGERTLSAAEAKTKSIEEFQYDIQNLLPHGADTSGIILDFRIKAYAIDAASPRTPRGPQIVRLPQNITYITLE